MDIGLITANNMDKEREEHEDCSLGIKFSTIW